MIRWSVAMLWMMTVPVIGSAQTTDGTSGTDGTNGAGTAPTLSCTLNGPLDRMTTPSSACLTCHDGSKVSSGAPDARSGHKYDFLYYTGGKPDLRDKPTSFNSRVVLPNGNVTCVTCHDPASSQPYHLAAPTSGPVDQRLCVACHVQ